MESGSIGGGTMSQVAIQSVSWAVDVAKTMGPSSTQECAAAHIGQCSPEV